MKAALLQILVNLTVVTFVGFALAHSGATGVVKERMDLMSDIGEQMKTIGQMVKGKTKFDGQKISAAAKRLAEHSNRIPDLFPGGSNGHPSEALPIIWSDWEDFVEMSHRLHDRAKELSEVTKTATETAAIIKPFLALGKTCTGCHQKFRQEK